MRLDIERQNKLEPIRLLKAKTALQNMGFEITYESTRELRFTFKKSTVYYFPYSGWHTGASITDGRGWHKLLKQLTA